MGAVSFWHLTIERPGLSFGDLIWLPQSGRSPRPAQGRDLSFDTFPHRAAVSHDLTVAGLSTPMLT
jgi:hypothetical protein